MTTRLYLTPLPESQATTPPENGVSSRVDMAGLLEQGGVATEMIATSKIDLTIEGQFRFGPRFSEKLAREVRSLAESSYSPVPLFNDDDQTSEPNKGYYELQSADVNPAHKSTGDAQQYSVSLSSSGTKENHWRAVRTSVDNVETGLATGSAGLVGVPSGSQKIRWFDTADGFEPATIAGSHGGELGATPMYDPSSSSFTNPTLLFEVPYESEGLTDVRVWDDMGESSKHASFADGSGGTVDVTQWVHAYHPGFEFEGSAIVDNGALRVRFDEPNGVIEAWEWDTLNDAWNSVTINHGDYELFDADIGHGSDGFGPSKVDVYAEFEDTTDGSIYPTVLSFQRGIQGVVLRQPPNEVVPGTLESVISPIASNQTTDPNPSQGVKARKEVK